MIPKHFPRPARPYLPALQSTLVPFLVVANAGSFHLAWDGTQAVIEQGSWDGVDLAAVQAVVDAAPVWSTTLTAKDVLNILPLWEEAIFRVFLGLINENRAALGKSTLSAGAFFNLVKTKIDTL